MELVGGNYRPVMVGCLNAVASQAALDLARVPTAPENGDINKKIVGTQGNKRAISLEMKTAKRKLFDAPIPGIEPESLP